MNSIFTSLITAIETALADFKHFPRLRELLFTFPVSKHVHVLAIGKSAPPMAEVAIETLTAKQVSYDGYMLTKYGHTGSELPNLQIREAGHPLPDANSLRHSAEILDWLQTLATSEDLIVLLSGGGSALFEVLENGYTLGDLVNTNNVLLHSGLNIAEMNRQRSRLSKVKGSKALANVPCKRIFVFALSDVEGNDPSVIASNPFNPNCVNNTEDNHEVSYHVIGDNLSFRKLLSAFLPKPVCLYDSFISTSSDHTAKWLADFALNCSGKGLYLFGGESPVPVSGKGKGGRCTHLALDFAIRIAGSRGISLLTYATDGSDNVAGIAGAWVNGNTAMLLQSKGIDAEEALHNCDSLSALHTIGAIIPACSHRVNVNDLYILQIP